MLTTCTARQGFVSQKQRCAGSAAAWRRPTSAISRRITTSLAKPQRQVAAASSSSYYPEVPKSDGSFSATDLSSGASEPLADVEGTEEQALLREASSATKNLSFVAFWLQFALSVVSAGILVFSMAFVPKAPGVPSIDVSKYLTLVGVVAAFVSSLFAHGFLTLSRKIANGGVVARSYLVGTTLTNNAICLAGIGITVIGLQASVGTLVAKTLMTAMSGPYVVGQANSGLVSLDVFSLQASTNVLLCHVIGLLYTNLMLRLVNRAAPKAA